MEQFSSDQALIEQKQESQIQQETNQILNVAGLQHKQGPSFVARRNMNSKTMPLLIQTKPQNSKYVQAMVQNLKLQEASTSKTKESPSSGEYELKEELNESSSSDSSARPIIRITTHFPESNLFSNLEL